MKFLNKNYALCLTALMSSAYLMGMDDSFNDSPATKAYRAAAQAKTANNFATICDQRDQEIERLRYINNQYRALIQTNKPAPIATQIPQAYVTKRTNIDMVNKRFAIQSQLIGELEKNNTFIRGTYLGKQYLKHVVDDIETHARLLFPPLPAPTVALRPAAETALARSQVLNESLLASSPVRPITPVQAQPTPQSPFSAGTLTQMNSGIAVPFVSPQTIASPALQNSFANRTFTQSRSGIQRSFPTFASPASAAYSATNTTQQNSSSITVGTPTPSSVSSRSSQSVASTGCSSTPTSFASSSTPQTVVESSSHSPARAATPATPKTPASARRPHAQTRGNFGAPVTPQPADFSTCDDSVINRPGLHRDPAYYVQSAEMPQQAMHADISFNVQPEAVELAPAALQAEDTYIGGGLRRQQAYYYDRAEPASPAREATAIKPEEAVSPVTARYIHPAPQDAQQPVVTAATQAAPIIANAIHPSVVLDGRQRVHQAPAQTTQAQQSNVRYIRKLGIGGIVKDFMVLNNPPKK